MAVLIHTADLHLGRMLYGERLLADQVEVLTQLKQVLIDESADALLIAGDVFDRAVPPAEAVEVLDTFLTEVVRDLGVPVVLIPGNHDSADRLGFGARLLGEQLHIVAGLDRVQTPLVIHDAHGAIQIFGVPYLEPARVRMFTGDDSVRDQDSAHRAIVQHLSNSAPCERRVLVTHAFVTGGLESDSERPLCIGGLDTVDASTFAGFDYVALGHLHRPQAVAAEHICYSGSPLRYSISECGYEKSFTRIELGEKGNVAVDRVAITPTRDLVLVEGTIDALLSEPSAARPLDLVVARLTDKGPVHSAMQRLRERWPNAVHVERTFAAQVQASQLAGGDHRTLSTIALFESFFEALMGEPLSENERAVLDEIYASTSTGEQTP